jgi:hypothetical protein
MTFYRVVEKLGWATSRESGDRRVSNDRVVFWKVRNTVGFVIPFAISLWLFCLVWGGIGERRKRGGIERGRYVEEALDGGGGRC